VERALNYSRVTIGALIMFYGGLIGGLVLGSHGLMLLAQAVGLIIAVTGRQKRSM
jgi:hypothetical protein